MGGVQLIRGHTIDCGWLAEGTYLPADLHSKVGMGGVQLIRGRTIDCGWLAEGTYLLADLHSKVGMGEGVS